MDLKIIGKLTGDISLAQGELGKLRDVLGYLARGGHVSVALRAYYDREGTESKLVEYKLPPSSKADAGRATHVELFKLWVNHRISMVESELLTLKQALREEANRETSEA